MEEKNNKDNEKKEMHNEVKNTEETNNENSSNNQDNQSRNKMNIFLLLFLALIIITLTSLIGYLIFYDKNNKTFEEETKEIEIIKEVTSINDIDTIHSNINDINYEENENYNYVNDDSKYYIENGKLYFKTGNEEPYLVEETSFLNIKKMVDCIDATYVLTTNNEIYGLFPTNHIKMFIVSKITDEKAVDITSKNIILEKENECKLVYKKNNIDYIYIDKNNIKELSDFLKEYDYLELYSTNMSFGYTINNDKQLVEYYDKENKKIYLDNKNNNIYPKYIINDEINNTIYIIDSKKVYESKEEFDMKKLGTYSHLETNDESIELQINNNKYIFKKK